MHTKKHDRHLKHNDLENLGLDADHSSDNFSVNGRYNTDNERISHNPGGEEDLPPQANPAETSPLDEK